MGAGNKPEKSWVNRQNLSAHGVSWVDCCREGATASPYGDNPHNVEAAVNVGRGSKKLWGIVYLGVNDAKVSNWSKLGYAETFVERMKAIKKLIKDRDMKCLLVIPPSGPSVHEAYSTEALKKEIPDLIHTIKTGPNTRILDPRTFMASNVYYHDDHVTLNEEGHKVMSQQVLDALMSKK